MTTLYQVLEKLDFPAEKIYGIAQTLLIGGKNNKNAFDNLEELRKEAHLESAQKNWLLRIKPQMEKITIPQTWFTQDRQIWQNEYIVDDLLRGDCFASLSEQELLEFVVGITQLQFFVSHPKFSTQNCQANFYELDKRQEASFALEQLLKKLGFCQERTYQQEDGIIDEINIHAASEIALIERLKWAKNIIEQQPKPVTIVYATNPRGISQTEESCAPILAQWFAPHDSEKQQQILQCIRAVFDDKKNKLLDWYRNLNQLQGKILQKINEHLLLNLQEFPQAPDGIAYAPEYDQAAEADKRDALNNRWPHIGHLLDYLFQQLHINAEQVKLKLLLVPGKMIGNRYIPAKTWDLIDASLNNATQQQKSTLYYVSDNSITHAASRQDLISKILHRHHSLTVECITYHNPLNPSKIVPERLFKEITAELHDIYEFSNTLDKPFLIKETASQPTLACS